MPNVVRRIIDNPIVGATIVGLCQVYSAALLLGGTNVAALSWHSVPIAAAAFIVAAAVGLTAAFALHPFRGRGLLPPAMTFIPLTVYASHATGWIDPWVLIPLGLSAGLVQGICIRYTSNPPLRWRAGYAIAILAVVVPGTLTWTTALADSILSSSPKSLERAYWTGPAFSVRWMTFVGAGLFLTSLSWLCLRRPIVELIVATGLCIAYRLRGTGPGLAACPLRGPILVIANHASYFDPLFVAALLPRPVTPMMTASFFDKPIIRQLMVHVFDTIRVSETAIKREVTELNEAIAALGQGKCVVIFPEGYLRRREDQPLRRFGRGVWEILKAHPNTPVLACWVEGAWGSYFSFKDGPPTQNKPRDFRHPIQVGVSVPEVVPASVLEHHLATRLHLMNLVLGARKHLGLQELPPMMVPKESPAEDANS